MENEDGGYDVAAMSGCTACVVLITPNKIFCANVGDSRSVLYKSGEPVPLSTDHKPNLPDEKKRIEMAEGIVSNGRVDDCLSLSRAMGDFDFKEDSERPLNQQKIIVDAEIKIIERS